MRKTLLVGTMVTAFFLGACGDDHSHGDECGSGELTYEAAAAGFAEKYCTNCHDSSLPEGVARANAPIDLNFDHQDAWLEHGGHALQEIMAGRMPLTGPKPEPAEVEKLEQWLSCEGAAEPHDHEH